MSDETAVLLIFCAICAWPLSVVVLFLAECFSALTETSR